MRQINKIVLHCSASNYGDEEPIKSRYHYVILNSYPSRLSFKSKRPEIYSDGNVQEGRELESPGVHVKGHNADSIGICLVGGRIFTGLQLLSLRNLIATLEEKFGKLDLFGHYEFWAGKTCPNINMDHLRDWLNT